MVMIYKKQEGTRKKYIFIRLKESSKDVELFNSDIYYINYLDYYNRICNERTTMDAKEHSLIIALNLLVYCKENNIISYSFESDKNILYDISELDTENIDVNYLRTVLSIENIKTIILE